MAKPSGIIGKPDGKTLYVADIGDNKTYLYTINNKGGKIEHFKIYEDLTANVTFGGKNLDILFITARGSVYTLEMNVKGEPQ